MDKAKYDGFSKGTFRQTWFSFEGRLNRQSYIVSILFVAIASILAMCLSAAFIAAFAVGLHMPWLWAVYAFICIFLIGIPTSVSLLSLTFRRGHDVKLSGWIFGTLYGLSFIPSLVPSLLQNSAVAVIFFIVSIVNLVLGLYLLFKKGTNGPNVYGPDPLGAKAPAAAPVQPVAATPSAPASPAAAPQSEPETAAAEKKDN